MRSLDDLPSQRRNTSGRRPWTATYTGPLQELQTMLRAFRLNGQRILSVQRADPHGTWSITLEPDD